MSVTTAGSDMHALDRTQSPSFERFGGLCALLAGIVNFLYAVAFVVIARSAPGLGALLSSLFLLLGGLLATAALAAVYQRLQRVDPAFALWALLLGIIGGLGAAVHGGYDLANVLHPPAGVPNVDLPSQVDPRGLVTFGVMGIALFVIAWLMGRSGEFPRGLAYLGYLLAVLFVILYLARLIILNPANPVLLVPVLLAGFIVNPAWYIWLGLSLWRKR